VKVTQPYRYSAKQNTKYREVFICMVCTPSHNLDVLKVVLRTVDRHCS